MQRHHPPQLIGDCHPFSLSILILFADEFDIEMKKRAIGRKEQTKEKPSK